MNHKIGGDSMKNKALVLDDCRIVPGRIVRVLDKRKEDDTDNVEDETKNVKLVVWVEDANGKNERPLMFTEDTFKDAEDLAKENPEDIPQKSVLQNMID
jgi:hypothetical protein|tara:strand:+ start:1353 stop:1649 length:297 start_codon:yes stop_codon:yes gene_type:complete